ncbi:hypothetical protein [Nostoc sp. LEGE 12450]|uniref:hypothetical protein n=1 Tax=Nostoc sp. LEGE 12450 TaxID=1828643 RepID=UPI001880E16B|nr:hypothetical protein [Nostoc sp. LEGE 12450]MBE8987283.1 hypothetical protein [Nostoc sp. LEGE 12450]
MADSSTSNPNSQQESILNANVSDQAAESDSLGFEPYVSAIASPRSPTSLRSRGSD